MVIIPQMYGGVAGGGNIAGDGGKITISGGDSGGHSRWISAGGACWTTTGGDTAVATGFSSTVKLANTDQPLPTGPTALTAQ